MVARAAIDRDSRPRRPRAAPNAAARPARGGDRGRRRDLSRSLRRVERAANASLPAPGRNSAFGPLLRSTQCPISASPPPTARPATSRARSGSSPPRSRRQPRADAPRRDRHRQDGDDGLGHRGAPAPGARDRAQQDARRAALQRVPRVLPRRTRSSTSSPTTTTTSPRRTSRRPTSTSRRTRRRTTTSPGCGSAATQLAPHAARRRRRRVACRASTASARRRSGARAVLHPRGRRGARPRRGAAQADRHPVRPQRHACSAAAASACKGDVVEVQPANSETAYRDLVLRRRGRADLALRPAHRRGAREARQPRDLAGDRVRHLEADDRARGRRDPRRARAAGRGVRGARGGCSRRTASASAPSTTSR